MNAATRSLKIFLIISASVSVPLAAFAAHSGGDIALFASRAELRLAALLHRHYLAKNDPYSGDAI